ncbi:MAG: FxDxF family PEP-CTERM protein [Proteobacteria bacterium]|nr:FxDxF family PEP-CTERM protein [Pseudomonadota bacterium]
MSINTKLGLVAAVASLAVAGGASATTFIMPWTTSSTGAISVAIGDDGLSNPGGSTDPVNGNSTHTYNSSTGVFTDTFDFFLPTGFAGASAITTISGVATNDLNFTNISFNGVSGTTATGGGTSTAHVDLQPITAGGEQHLVISGNGGGAATFGGTVSFVLANAGVPEPTSWALMILGFGGAGALLRQQRRRAFA